MNLSLRREEAIYIRDLIIGDLASYGESKIKTLYGNIDLSSILQQLSIIIMLAESVDEEERIKEIFNET